MTELTELAKLDKLVSGKKEEVTMESAMSNNEKIRDWVSHFGLSIVCCSAVYFFIILI
jgi:hypothetical protein